MVFKHLFKARLCWISKEKSSPLEPRLYSKSHTISIEGKPDLPISAAKDFKGDPSLYNPEDLLLSSLISCHMMSYLYCCSKNNIEVVKYSDHAEATLQVNEDGSGRIVNVILNPVITIKDSNKRELAISLHHKASQLCFIANSCNFPVEHHPVIHVLS